MLPRGGCPASFLAAEPHVMKTLLLVFEEPLQRRLLVGIPAFAELGFEPLDVLSSDEIFHCATPGCEPQAQNSIID